MKLKESERNRLMQTLDDVYDLLTEADYLLGTLGVEHYNQSKKLTAAAISLGTVIQTLQLVSQEAADEDEDWEFLNDR